MDLPVIALKYTVENCAKQVNVTSYANMSGELMHQSKNAYALMKFCTFFFLNLLPMIANFGSITFYTILHRMFGISTRKFNSKLFNYRKSACLHMFLNMLLKSRETRQHKMIEPFS